MRWIKRWVVDPEEPTVFGQWVCDLCGAETPIRVARKLQMAQEEVLMRRKVLNKHIEQLIKTAENSGVF